MDNKALQRRRMMSYFIEATRDIIETQGIDAISIRGVAEKAGFNSATLYNYFKDLDDLIFFTSLGYLKDYALDLRNYSARPQSNLEWYLGIWECFCAHSFRRPQIFHTIFFAKSSHSLNSDIETYYSIFPEELGQDNEGILRSMLLGNTIFERNMTLLKRLVDDGIVTEAHVDTVNEMTCLIYQGLLSRVISGEETLPADQLTRKMYGFVLRALMACENDLIHPYFL